MSVETRTIAFKNLGGRSGPLCWSQKVMWNTLQRVGEDDQRLSPQIDVELPTGASLAGIESCIRILLSRHESLRTVYPVVEGVPRQEVCDAGSVPLILFPASGAEASEQPPELSGRFDTRIELPLRAGVVLRAGRPVRLRLCLSHLATDAAASGVIREEAGTLLQAVDPYAAVLPPVAKQPVEIAKDQRRKDAESHYEATYSYWRDLFKRSRNLSLNAVAGDGRRPRFWHGVFESRRMFDAVSVLARAEGLTESSVMLSSVMTSLGEALSRREFFINLNINNRFDTDTRRTVAYRCQNVPILLEVDPEDLIGSARRAGTALLRAYRYSEYDPDVITAIMPDASRFPAITYNFLPPRRDRSTSSRADRFTWIDRFDNERFAFYLTVKMGRSLDILVDTALIAPDQVEHAVRKMCQDVVALADGMGTHLPG